MQIFVEVEIRACDLDNYNEDPSDFISIFCKYDISCLTVKRIKRNNVYKYALSIMGEEDNIYEYLAELKSNNFKIRIFDGIEGGSPF